MALQSPVKTLWRSSLRFKNVVLTPIFCNFFKIIYVLKRSSDGIVRWLAVSLAEFEFRLGTPWRFNPLSLEL